MLAFYLNPFWRMGKRGWGAVRLCRIEVGFFREESVGLRCPEGKDDSESGLGGVKFGHLGVETGSQGVWSSADVRRVRNYGASLGVLVGM